VTLRDIGSGRVHAGEADMVIVPQRWEGGGPLVVVAHGAGGSPSSYYDPSARRDLDLLADTGCCVLIADLGGTNTWANDVAQARTAEAIVHGGTAWGADTSRVALIGDSMGAMGHLIYFANNPTQIACVVGRIPVVAADALHDRQLGGLGLLIDAAYGSQAAWEAAKATKDPSAAGPAAILAGLAARIRLLYSVDDPTVLPADVASFCALTGVEARPLGAIGHDQATLGPAIDAYAQARFIWDHLA
jgi:acetyl esterase/lipase